MNDRRPILSISAKSILVYLSILAFLFFFAHLFTQWVIYNNSVQEGTLLFKSLDKFNVSLEISIPTWYSQVLLFVSGVLMLFIALIRKLTQDKYRGWLFLGVIFLYMSIDEGAELHELARLPMDSLQLNSGAFASSWVIPWLAVCSIVIILFYRFWLKLPKKTRLLFFIAGMFFVGGAIGMEMIGSLLYNQHSGDMRSTFMFQVYFAVEELFEMIGATIFLYSLIDYIRCYSLDKKIVLKISR